MELIEFDRAVPIIESIIGLKCVKFGLHYGSVIYFDLDKLIPTPRMYGGEILIGSSTIEVGHAYWRAFLNGKEIFNGKNVSRSIVDRFNNLIVGSSFLKVKPLIHKQAISLAFSGGFNVRIDLSGKWKADDVLTFYLSDGKILKLRPTRVIAICDEVDDVRRNNFQATKPALMRAEIKREECQKEQED